VRLAFALGVCSLAFACGFRADTGGAATAAKVQHRVGQLNPCDMHLVALAAATNGAGGALIPSISIYNTAATACRLRVNLTFSVRGGSGEALPIRGNPARITLKARRLGRAQRAWVSWSWRNWCGRAKPPFIYEGRIGQMEVRLLEHVRPRCDQGTSTITLLLACPQPENASLVAPKLRETARLACRR
jgi:hypothetical protein